MQSNNPKPSSTSVVKWPLPTMAIICGAVFILILILTVYSYKQIQAASYARLAPVSVSLQLNYQNEQFSQNEVVLEYDYGYGFIPAHRQSHIIKSRPDSQVVEFAISAWKPIYAARLSVKQQRGFKPISVTFAKLDKSIQVTPGEIDSGVVLTIDNLAKLLLESPASPTIAKVN